MNERITIKGLEQGRAKFAYECAKKGSESEKKKEYRAYVKKVPMYIKTNGLGSTFAFINAKRSGDQSKADYAYELIYKHTAQWLMKDRKTLISLNKEEDLVKELITLNSPEYRAVTNEVLSFFRWLIRFADGLIKGDT